MSYESRTCNAEACAKGTHGGKPFCPEHVLENPYAAEVARRWARGERAKEACAKEVTTCGECGREFSYRANCRPPKSCSSRCKQRRAKRIRREERGRELELDLRESA